MPTEQTIQSMTGVEYEVIYGSPTELRTPAELFDYMVERLVGVKFAEYTHADPFRKRIPDNRRFLFCPPEPKDPDLALLMDKVEFLGRTGKNYLHAAHLMNVIAVPEGSCLLLDTEDGRARLKAKPSVSRERIASEMRIPYTTFWGIIHAFLFPVFAHHNMYLIGSCYGARDGDVGSVPHLQMSNGRPILLNELECCGRSRSGAPSCGSVLV